MSQLQLKYLLQQQCSGQWKGYLVALAAEFSEQLSVEDLRTLGRRIGARFAATTPLPDCRTLSEFEAGANVLWRERSWGYIELKEDADGLRVIHYCSPLPIAFGNEALAWSPAFLEGVYASWFAASGAGELLKLTQISDCDHLGTIEFRLGR